MNRTRAVAILVLLLASMASVSCAQQRNPCELSPIGVVSERVEPQESNFILYISNQSFAIDPVDIKVSIDGVVVVSGCFAFKDAHAWKKYPLLVQQGRHYLVAESTKGHTYYAGYFMVSDKKWGVLDFWYYPKSWRNPTPCHFEFEAADGPPGFV